MTTKELPRLARAKPGKTPFSVEVAWKGGGRDLIDMSGVIARSERLAPLRDPELFRQLEIVSWGSGIGWPNGLDYGADTLAILAEEQRPMTGADLAGLRREVGLSQQELADALGVRKRTVQNYESSESVPAVVRMAARLLARDRTVLGAHYRPRKAGRPRKMGAAST